MNHPRPIMSRLVLCLLVVAIYFFMWRPVRYYFNQTLVYKSLSLAGPHRYQLKKEGLGIAITFIGQHHQKTIRYRPQAGFFLLLYVITIVLTGGKYRWWGYVFILHLGSTFLTALLIIAGRNGWYGGFLMSDFLGMYLMPRITLALTFLAIAAKLHAPQNGIKSVVRS